MWVHRLPWPTAWADRPCPPSPSAPAPSLGLSLSCRQPGFVGGGAGVPCPGAPGLPAATTGGQQRARGLVVAQSLGGWAPRPYLWVLGAGDGFRRASGFPHPTVHDPRPPACVWGRPSPRAACAGVHIVETYHSPTAGQFRVSGFPCVHRWPSPGGVAEASRVTIRRQEARAADLALGCVPRAPPHPTPWLGRVPRPVLASPDFAGAGVFCVQVAGPRCPGLSGALLGES